MVLDARSLKCKISNKPNFFQPIVLHFGGFVLIVSTDSQTSPPQIKSLEIFVALKKCI